ncbi:hypothetical protein B0J12DRAFT_672594 [Macrophomina phaseolina]|uniref:Uncharacterized protein n=1 Tax=Macrophomina phaseolina TaxID=35725 RepID=A0ABQ8G303_9PEZI|nr:hypothetical protein B0J12DRAFT_672594 [Macrophomina phaseolina]
MVYFIQKAIATALLLAGFASSMPPDTRQISCDPPPGTNDATYSACAVPVKPGYGDNDFAILAVAEYMWNSMGCRNFQGGSARPVKQITSHRCTHPGPFDNIYEAVDGWAINTAFNPAPCRPGSRCL